MNGHYATVTLVVIVGQDADMGEVATAVAKPHEASVTFVSAQPGVTRYALDQGASPDDWWPEEEGA